MTDKTPRVFAHASGPRRAPLAIHPRAFDVVWDASADAGDVEVVDGVAIVDVRGPLCQHANWFFDGYDAVAKRFADALESEAQSVVLEIGSPGGDVEGLFECARVMRQAASKAGKAVVAYVDESAYSAAYAIACVADSIYLPPAGGVGSVGVVGELLDVSAMEKEHGVRVAVIASGDQKADGHPSVPLTDDVIERAQARVDQLAGLFFRWVAMRRGMSTGEVSALEAACVYGESAVAAGLADGIRSRAGARRAALQLTGGGAPIGGAPKSPA